MSTTTLHVNVGLLREGDILITPGGWVALGDAFHEEPNETFPHGTWNLHVRFPDGGDGYRTWDIRPDVPLPTLPIARPTREDA